MQFTVISHACLYIEHLNTRLLIDPWLLGSCYWRSWWNYPEPVKELVDSIKPTHIYITHLHWDHYHGPSLRKFEKYQPTIIFPKHFNNRMVNDCKKGFKFKKIYEVDHGKQLKIGNNFSITSYQFNPLVIDSSLVVEADDINIFNANDSKVFGLSFKQILNKHKKFDFVLRSHSSASPTPHCIKGSNPENSYRSPRNYANEFAAFGKASQGKYIIPFASSHFYLHPDTEKYNKFYSNPKFVKEIFDKDNKGTQKCILMASGSKWSKEKGFKIIEHDYSLLDQHVEKAILENKDKLNKQLKKEKISTLNEVSFRKYYNRFLQSINFPFNFNFKFGFLINEKKSQRNFICIIDGTKKSTYVIRIDKESEIYKYQLSFVIKTSANIFNDCNSKMMHNTFSASKLLEIFLISKNSKKNLAKYFALIDFYENDCLPYFKLFSKRNIRIIIRRWREIIDIIYYIYLIKLKKREIADLYN